MESSSQDRRLPASERKLRKAREDGQVTRSTDLSHLAVLGSGALALLGLAPSLVERLKLQLSHQLAFDATTMRQPGDMLTRLGDMALVGLGGCVAFAAIIMCTVMLSSVAVGGWVLSAKPVVPDLTRLSPLAGFGRLFSKEKLTETLKLLFITAVLSLVAAWFFRKGLPTMSALLLQPSAASIREMNDWLVLGLGLMLAVILVVALIDVPLQTFLHKSRLKMSHQEAKQEHKETEGNPLIKGKMRQRQRELAQRNSVSAVPKADFVLMNPTHYAVALKYDEDSMAAPRVISKGADLLAMKIREIAKHHGIPVLQSPALARALYAHAELDRDIPTSLYTAVAQVLAYVYRLKAALRGEGPMPGEPPEPQVPSELDPQAAPELKGAAA
jgi:flagellar biosynthetic protein FlhB